ncbi:MAG: hypothetical protein BWY75_02499 [bacterium ADurb.Bin425]|nr:MAG: hypothetical protein BWY75_02499 [bacterium ADurb.Bin425]
MGGKQAAIGPERQEMLGFATALFGGAGIYVVILFVYFEAEKRELTFGKKTIIVIWFGNCMVLQWMSG